jgi:3-hydroxyisobutyrate dehydrogenase-like beta-hydroxyacid dehydrogenase
MAMRLLNAGYQLGVYNRSPDRARALGDAGARVYTSAADLAGDATHTHIDI